VAKSEVRRKAVTLYDFDARTIDGAEQSLDAYRGKVVLVVNVASHCGFTPQYEGLQRLYDTYADRGFVVLGFPSNQFGAQEPGSEAEIQEFCSLTYNVTFPMFAKVDVNGDDAHPMFGWLREQLSGFLGGRIKWNFTKFLVDRQGRPVRRYGSTTEPAALAGDIEKLLDA
jgi:glutathione peroxidase